MVQRRGWGIVAVAALVLMAGAGGGVLLRELQAAAGADEGIPAAPTSVLSPVKEPGPRTVVLVEDVAAHPYADQVRKVLQSHFDAINDGDYELWTDTVTRERARATARSVWRDQYRTTLDGSIVVHRLEPRPGGGLIALLSFTSVQDAADAPSDMPVTCLRWRVSYALVDEADGLRLALTSPSASLRTPC
ncbi:MAG: hypothetical protein ABR608_08065 [Pseudonocardiaceae bacterium]